MPASEVETGAVASDLEAFGTFTFVAAPGDDVPSIDLDG